MTLFVEEIIPWQRTLAGVIAVMSSVEIDRPEQQVTLSLPGISCAGCVGKIEKAFAADPDVSSCTVNLAEKTSHVITSSEPEHLVGVLEGIGFQASVVLSESENRRRQEEKDRAEYRRRIIHTVQALAVSVPLMAWGMITGEMSVTPESQVYWGLVGLLTLAVLVISGGHFFRGLWSSLKHKTATMDTLVALGTGSAWIYSMAVVLFPEALPEVARHVYFEASAMIIGLINFGQALELRAKGKTSEAIKRLLNLQVQHARLVTPEGEEDVPIELVKPGDVLRVRPGESLPVDGVVTEGSTTVDESMLTGEPLAVKKSTGDVLTGGTLNRNGSILMRAEKVGSETALARIIALVKQAQNSKMPISRLVDKVASIFVPVVISIALIAAVIWFLFGPAPAITHALVVAVTVLIIACPCALGLATPMSVMVGVGKAAELGMLVRQGDALQKASDLTTVVLDKTGTITEGKPRVTAIYCTGAFSKHQVVTTAGALESHSEHPLAEAVLEKAKGLELPYVRDFQAETGRGVAGCINNQQTLLGNEALMAAHDVKTHELSEQAVEIAGQGQTVIYLSIGGELAGVMGISDPVRADSKAAIERLHQLGLKVMMLTGDNPETAAAVASQVGIDDWRAQVLPADKERYVRELQEQGEKVGMTGDGINDAPALARADVGMAIGAGADVAIEAADITLMRSSLHGLSDAIELSRATMKNIRQNLFGAFIYNSLGIPVAAGVLYPLTGLLLNPVVAGAAMAFSSVTVVSNANRLRLFQPSERMES
ncbi:heavy metal translocating P-type ATPase [Sansalvadorimonas sp. 2012CJ34-2]|uniref:Copper-exporting P-type ATPase n=1 Tax=Parendozoicomonas callyspongiae TaxID=2942213 RepID=A0ABT0PJH8_9GAMM|nr:heavy metal translocating P-type ATPase [Sansalvadorimonas sp. 2012CJ34-2]MCL6271539.1 heavy metal translocating P-type ATPase [Sansalvadorimonas sp. 2012CJ34-2]